MYFIRENGSKEEEEEVEGDREEEEETHLKKEDSSSNKSGNVLPTHLIKQCLSCDEYTVRGRYMISKMIGHY